MFGIGSTELLVILVVALLVLGPKNLPKIAQTLGRAMGEFRKVSTEFQRTLNTEVAFEEEKEKRKKEREEEHKELAADQDKKAPARPEEDAAAGSSPSAPQRDVAQAAAPDVKPDVKKEEQA